MVSSELPSTTGLFERITEEVLGVISENSEVKQYYQGELIFSEGDYAEYTNILLDGEVAIRVKLTSRPQSIIVAFLTHCNETFGWSGVVPPYYYAASALCESQCDAISILRKKLVDVLRQEPLSGFKIIQHITELVSSRLRNSRAVLLKSL